MTVDHVYDQLSVDSSCPGQVELDPAHFYNGTYFAEISYTLNYSVPNSFIDIFSSGTKNQSITGAFDIQPRILGTSTAILSFPPNETVLQGIANGIQYVLLDGKVEAVEGLILDTRVGNASIGFRNHTLPIRNMSAQWTEDILFIEPLTSCVGTFLFHYL